MEKKFFFIKAGKKLQIARLLEYRNFENYLRKSNNFIIFSPSKPKDFLAALYERF